MSAALTISIPRLAPSLNGGKGLMRMHHAAYRRVREAWVYEVLAALSDTRRAPVPCAVTITRRYAVHPLDLDNLYAAAKVPLDALRHAGVIPDDDPACVASLACVQEKVAKKAEQETIIELSRID